MKVKIETAGAAILFGCDIGDERDLQRQDARPLLDSGDVAAVDETAAKPKRTRKRG